MDKEKFVFLDEMIKDIIIEMRYYSTYNFVGERITGYEGNYAILTKEAATSLKKANEELLKLGLCLKIYDAYRPVMAVEHFVNWSKNNDEKMKEYFYPNLTKQELFQKKLIDNKSAHSRGSTVDLTIYDLGNNKELDMGSTFDLFTDTSAYNYPNISAEAKKNRQLLKNIMEKNGFIMNNSEWWHYTLKDEPYKDIYFNFKIKK